MCKCASFLSGGKPFSFHEVNDMEYESRLMCNILIMPVLNFTPYIHIFFSSLLLLSTSHNHVKNGKLAKSLCASRALHTWTAKTVQNYRKFYEYLNTYKKMLNNDENSQATVWQCRRKTRVKKVNSNEQNWFMYEHCRTRTTCTNSMHIVDITFHIIMLSDHLWAVKSENVQLID